MATPNPIYKKIVTKIDDAILKYADKPVELTIDGQTVKRDLPGLMVLRKKYQSMIDQAGGGRGFQLNYMQSGGGR